MKKSFLLLLVLAMLCPIAACSSGSGTAETQAPITEGAPSETNAPETDAETAEPKTNPYKDLPATPAEIDALIASIPGAEIENVNDIDRAYYAYCQLPEADRAAVTKLGDLQTLRSELLKRYVVKEYKDARIPHEKFLIGAFPFYRYDDEHIEQLVDAKIDFVLCLSTVHEYSMSQMNKYGIGVIAEMNKIGLPSWIGAFENGTLINPITEEEIRSQIDSGNVTDYPALWGFYISDEPNANEFPYLSTLARVSKEYLPQTAVYCNLFPTYASRAQLGIFNYEAYVGGFVKDIESDIISFDHYYENQDIIDTIKNMQIVSEAAANSGRDFWDFLQIGRSNPDFPEISADMLRYQAYLSMAYGCKSIAWFCWDNATWYGNVMDSNGNPTVSYDRVKEVDAELKALEPIYMRYSGSSAALLLGENAVVTNTVNDYYEKGNNKLKRFVSDYGYKRLAQTSIWDLNGSDDDFLIVGYLTKNVGKGEAFLFIDSTDKLFLDDARDRATATFKTVDPSSVVVAYVRGVPTLLTPDAHGNYTVEIRGADAVFVTVD